MSARDRTIRVLSSTKLAMALCLLLAAGGAAGSLLYRGNTAFDRPSAFNVFRSPLFLAPAFLLLVNVLFCAGKRLSGMRASSAQTWTFGGIHLGIVLLIAGMTVDGLYGFVATGYFFAGAPSGAHRDWRAGRDATFPFLLDVREIRVEHHPIDLRIGIRDPAGRKLGPYQVREGVAIRAGDPAITIVPRRFDVTTKTLIFDASAGGVTAGGLVAGTEGSQPVAGYTVVPVAFHDPEPSDYVVAVRFLRPGVPPEERIIRINSPARYAGLSFCIVTQGVDRYGNAYVGLQVTREPGEGLFWTGGILFGVALLGHLLARRLPVAARAPETGMSAGAARPAAEIIAGVLAAALIASVPAEAGTKGRVIDGETVWEGEVRVTEPVTVEKGGTLRIRPGTTVLLSGRDRDGDGCRDGYILVYGVLLAEGEKGRPVRFAPLSPGERWEEIFLGDAKAVIRHAVIEGANWGLHVHEGDVTVERTLFRENGGGARTRGNGTRFVRCTFRGNGIGLRFWDGGPQVTASAIEDNGTGLFYRDGRGGGRIAASRIANREWDLKVGDWATGDLDAAGNYWGSADREGLPRRFKDFRDGRTGRVTLSPALHAPPAGCGAEE